jgi:hypothetical protein
LCFILKTKSVHCHVLIIQINLESTASTTTSLPLNVVKTTGTSHDAIIPIASLFSSMDFIHPSTIMKKSPSPYTPMRRATSCLQPEQEYEHTNM